MTKSDATVANINARSAISTAKTRAAILRALRKVTPADLEEGTLDKALHQAWTIGWSAAVKDMEEG